MSTRTKTPVRGSQRSAAIGDTAANRAAGIGASLVVAVVEVSAAGQEPREEERRESKRNTPCRHLPTLGDLDGCQKNGSSSSEECRGQGAYLACPIEMAKTSQSGGVAPAHRGAADLPDFTLDKNPLRAILSVAGLEATAPVGARVLASVKEKTRMVTLSGFTWVGSPPSPPVTQRLKWIRRAAARRGYLGDSKACHTAPMCADVTVALSACTH